MSLERQAYRVSLDETVPMAHWEPKGQPDRRVLRVSEARQVQGAENPAQRALRVSKAQRVQRVQQVSRVQRVPRGQRDQAAVTRALRVSQARRVQQGSKESQDQSEPTALQVSEVRSACPVLKAQRV